MVFWLITFYFFAISSEKKSALLWLLPIAYIVFEYAMLHYFEMNTIISLTLIFPGLYTLLMVLLCSTFWFSRPTLVIIPLRIVAVLCVFVEFLTSGYVGGGV